MLTQSVTGSCHCVIEVSLERSIHRIPRCSQQKKRRKVWGGGRNEAVRSRRQQDGHPAGVGPRDRRRLSRPRPLPAVNETTRAVAPVGVQRGPSVCRRRVLVVRALSTEARPAEEYSHTPVMLQEVIESLNIQDDQTILDLTFGAGGHTRCILEAARGVRVLALDRDPSAHGRAQEMAKHYPPGRLVPLLGRFSELGPLLADQGLAEGSLDGALLDCGCSSAQMDDPRRGFGLARDGPLDMRMDAARFPDEPTAADVVNSLDYDSLVKVLKVYGEEKRAKKVCLLLLLPLFLLAGGLAEPWSMGGSTCVQLPSDSLELQFLLGAHKGPELRWTFGQVVNHKIWTEEEGEWQGKHCFEPRCRNSAGISEKVDIAAHAASFCAGT
ncbi:hypothetical protein HPB48_004262 [Haemaphysalis longicornis]|uniref:Methyltransferase-like protein 15 n=1 Tax=Haemaphysalis longicornis TaxID=44386 RepID=A0A9J6GVS6_HAELO|nr:hypothetical protein HPB48_004262 [Haemaphysalis longicornis]